MTLPIWMCTSPAKSPTKPGLKDKNGRNAFSIDYATIIHSNFFRRLSNKTQVFSNPTPDFVRTRLTHSKEVEQISRQLVRCLIQILRENNFSVDEQTACHMEDLVAATSLAHDIGHAPFGHTGKSILDSLCKEFCTPRDKDPKELKRDQVSFDDNQQSIHMLINPNFYESLQVSCALVDCVIKKKTEPCYEEDLTFLKPILEATGTENYRNPLSYLMEAADDIAYIAADLEDCLRILSAKHLDKKNFNAFLASVEKVPAKDKDRNPTNLRALLNEPLHFVQNSHLAHVAVLKWCINHVVISLKEAVESSNERDLNSLPKILHEFADNKTISKVKSKGELNFLFTDNNGDYEGSDFRGVKSALYSWLLKTDPISRQDVLIKKVLHDTWHTLEELTEKEYLKNPAFGLLDTDFRSRISMAHEGTSKETPIRVIVDYISGMTDRYTIEFWNKLQNPEYLKLAS